MIFYRIFFIISLIAAGCVFTSCSKDDDNEASTASTNTNANAVIKNDRSVTRLEMPRRSGLYDYITHYTSDGTLNYALEYSTSKMHAHWVAYRYDSKVKAQATSRTDAWGAEPYYNDNKQYQMAVCYFNGYNRGHLVGSAERLYSKEANTQTFYMSNMSPMNGNFNSIYWGEIETLVRNWGRACTAGDTLYVVKGGTIDERITGTISVPNTAGDYVKMVVPQYYYIAVLFLSKEGTYRAIGFWLEHKDYNNQSSTFLQTMRRTAACSIDELEEKTGLDFFCNLPDKVENAVEKQYYIASWSGL